MVFDPNNLRICGGQKSCMSMKQLLTSYYYWLNNIEGLLLADLKMIYKLISFMGPFFRKWKEKTLRNNFSSSKSLNERKINIMIQTARSMIMYSVLLVRFHS